MGDSASRRYPQQLERESVRSSAAACDERGMKSTAGKTPKALPGANLCEFVRSRTERGGFGLGFRATADGELAYAANCL